MFYMILAVDREKMSFVQKYFWHVKNPKTHDEMFFGQT